MPNFGMLLAHIFLFSITDEMKKLITTFLGFVLLLGIGGAADAVAASKKKAKAGSSSSAPKKYISKSSYRGNIGSYAITMTLYISDEYHSNAAGGGVIEYEGSYTYTKAGNTLRLKGIQGAHNDWNIDLDEYTPKGRNSGKFYLEELNNGNLSGTFINTSTKQRFKVYLTKIR